MDRGRDGLRERWTERMTSIYLSVFPWHAGLRGVGTCHTLRVEMNLGTARYNMVTYLQNVRKNG